MRQGVQKSSAFRVSWPYFLFLSIKFSFQLLLFYFGDHESDWMKYPLLKLFIGAFLLFFFLISFSYSNAQHRFLAGTVLFKSGDTLKGYISEIPEE
jgi:hypothetical protein